MSDINTIAAIATGAVPGALSRYYLTEWSKKKFGTSFPIGTFFLNLTGCLAMGFFFAISKGITGYPKELDIQSIKTIGGKCSVGTQKSSSN